MKRSRRKKRRQVQVPIASMGDIAFLLIIFFLLLGDFNKDKAVPLTPPQSEHVKKSETDVVAHVAVDRHGNFYLDGSRVESAKDIERGVRVLLAGTVADEQRHVQFKCDANLLAETFEPAVKAIVEAGGIIELVGENPLKN